MYYKNNISDMILSQSTSAIYILLINKRKNIYKLGMTTDLRKRLQNYATGKESHPDIQFVALVDNPKKVEK